MTKISEKKRAKFTGRGKGPPFVQLLHKMVDSEEWAALSGTEVKLLVDIARQFNGSNNGNLCPALLRGRWRSESKMTRALKALEDSRWIVKTKQGGMGIGPSLYAVTWHPIDAHPKHDHPGEAVASNAWRSVKSPHPNQVLPAPESGVVTLLRKAS